MEPNTNAQSEKYIRIFELLIERAKVNIDARAKYIGIIYQELLQYKLHENAIIQLGCDPIRIYLQKEFVLEISVPIKEHNYMKVMVYHNNNPCSIQYYQGTILFLEHQSIKEVIGDKFHSVKILVAWANYLTELIQDGTIG